MNQCNIFISCDIENPVFNTDWVNQISNTLYHLLLVNAERQITIVTSFDFVDETISKNNFKDFNTFIILESESYFKNDKSQAEFELIKHAEVENKKNTHKLILTLSEDIANNGIEEEYIYNFSSLIKEYKETHATPESLFNNTQFWLILMDLVYNIGNCIDDKKTDPIGTVFLADSTPDLINEKSALRRELLYSGYEVLPKNQYFLSKSHLIAATKDALEKSEMIIQLFGSKQSRLLEDESIVMTQNNMAARYCDTNQNINRLIYIPRDLVFENREQRIIIEKLKRDNTSLTGAEIIQTPIEAFKSIVHERLRKLKRSKNYQQEDTRHKTYLLYNTKNEPERSDIIQVLNETNSEIIEPLKSGSKRDLLTHHRISLITCDSICLFFDSKHPEWVKSKHKDIIKSAGLGRKNPLEFKYLVVEKDDIFPEEEFYEFQKIVKEKPESLEKLKEIKTE